MINTMQPLVNLANANLKTTSRFMQSPDIAELTKSNIDKYVKVTQDSFAYLAQSGAMMQWSRENMDNVSRFANEYLQSVFGVFGLMTQGQNLLANRMQDFSNEVEQGVEATTQAFDQSAEEIEGQVEENVEEGVEEISHFSKARAKQQSKGRSPINSGKNSGLLGLHAMTVAGHGTRRASSEIREGFEFQAA